MLLIIGGFDPTSRAGILADVSMATQIGVPFRCCITTNTVQTELVFIRQSKTEDSLFREQLEALLQSVSFTGVKVGYLSDMGLARIAWDLIRKYGLRNVVIDPVIVGKRADRVLVDKEFLDFYVEKLFPLAEVVTPNWSEACVLTGGSGKETFVPELIEQKAKVISDLGRCNVIVSGKIIDNKNTDCLVNYLTKKGSWFEGKSFVFDKPIVGLGCRFSTAIASYLSKGRGLEEAVEESKLRIAEYLESPIPIRNQK